MRLLHPEWLGLLWTLPAFAALVLYAWARRRKAAAAFAGPGAARRPGAGRRRALKAGLVLLGMGLIAVALARPAWNPAPRPTQRTGRDLVFLVDVSRSMLATDLAPSRLGRAKLAITDVLDAAGGDRVAVVAFAGSAVVKCPLTTDYAFARLAVDDLSTESVSRGGTLIGDAIRTVLTQVFDEPDADGGAAGGSGGGSGRYRDIFLITDGEDHDSAPVDAARQAGAKGVRIIAIGLGSEHEGVAVPGPNGGSPLTYEGQTVRSKADPDALSAIAAASREGVAISAGTGNIELDRVYRRLVAGAERRRVESRDAVRYTEGFQVFLAAALAALTMEALLRDR